jgi:hypothetical protein
MEKCGVCWFYWLHSGRQKHFLFWTLTFQGHRNSESISEIVEEYIFQHGKNCTRQDLQYAAQERKYSEIRKILATLQMTKSIFPLLLFEPPRGSVRTPTSVFILSEQHIRRKPQGLGVRTSVRTPSGQDPQREHMFAQVSGCKCDSYE